MKRPQAVETCGLRVRWGLCVNLCSALEFESHPPIGVDGHCVNDGQPELIVEIGESIQFLHLEHKCSNGFRLGFPCSFCSAELFEPCLPLYWRLIRLRRSNSI